MRIGGFVPVAVLAAALQAGCAALAGNGDIVQERREVPAFTSVRVAHGFEGEVEQVLLPGQEGAWIRGDSNLLPRVALVVRDGVLQADLPDDLELLPTRPLVLTVKARSLEAVQAEDGSVVQAEGIVAEGFRAEAEDGSRIGLRGPGGAVLDVVAEDGSRVEAADWPALQVVARLEDGSHASVQALARLDAVLTDGSTLTCTGSPAVRNVDTRDGSTVTFP